MGSMIDEKIRELGSDKFVKAVRDVIKKLNAFQFHLETIKDTDDKELAEVCLDAAEEIFPGTKERIRDRKAEVYRDLADKCMAFGLL